VADIASGVVDVALQPIGTLVAGLAATTDVVGVTTAVGSALEMVPPVVESVPAIVTDVADVATGMVDVALQPVGSTLEMVPSVVESVPPMIMDLAEAATDLGEDLGDVAVQPVESALAGVQPLVSGLAETAADIAGIAAEDIATLVESVPPIVTDVAGAATDAGKTLVANPLDSAQIGGDDRADADAAGDTALAPSAKDLGSELMDSDDGLDVIGTLGGALASGGVIVIDGGASPPERASADDGRYTDVDLALRDPALGDQGTKPADERTNDRAVETADAPHGSHDKTGEAAGPPSAREHDVADKLGTATLFGGLTDSVDEIVLRGDHHLL